jgi:uncharacterized protein (DUF849 family)
MPYEQDLKEQEELKSRLMSDAARAQAKAREAQGATGMGEDQEFTAKSVRVGNKAKYQADLEMVDESINRAIDKLAKEAGFADELEDAKFRKDMQNKFNRYKMEAFRKSIQAEKELKLRGMDQQKQMAFWQGLGGMTGSITAGIVSGIGKKGPDTSGGAGGSPDAGPGVRRTSGY